MPIVTLDDESTELDCTTKEECCLPETVSEVINEVIPTKNKYETVEIVNRDDKLEDIVQYISGQEWTVNYYLQLITKDNEIGRFDPYAPDVSKQYALLKDLIIYVDTPLTQDAAEELSGSGIINASVTPNEGDVIIAELMGKRTALLQIDKVTKKSYNLNNVFHIEYSVDMFLDSNFEMLSILNTKVAKTYYYDKDFLNTNSTPLLLEDEYDTKRKITISISDVIDYYFKTMYNSEKCLLSIPGQDTVIVDIMLQEFIFKIINSTDSTYIGKIHRNTVPDDAMTQPTLWTALLNRDIDILNSCNRKVVNVDTMLFTNNIRLRNISYLGIHYIAYPKTPDLNIMDNHSRASSGPIYTLKPVSNPHRGNKGEVATLIPTFTPEDEYYVFTEAFYNKDRANISILETITLDFLEGKSIDNNLLAMLIDDYKYWDRVQQFYFLPVLLVLLRNSVLRTSSVT